MAKEDFYGDGADKSDVSGRVDSSDGFRTASERVNETVFESPDAENQAEAFAEGLKSAAYIDYDVALEAHEAREDIETLASRRAREYGSDYDAGQFMRELPYRSGGNGYAPDPANPIQGAEGASS